MTYHPTTRVLAVLELLQTYHQLTAAEIARRLEVDARTVRRYIVMLQELGIPVATVRGRAGGYRLRPGYKLPPLIFNEREALAALLGLLTVAQSQQVRPDRAPDAIGALAKIARVLPAELRQRWVALQQTLVVQNPGVTAEPPPVEMLASLAVAIREERPVWLHYRSSRDEETERLVEPYGIVSLLGSWYLTGYCHLRHALRMFRIERIRDAQPRSGPYHRPEDFDPLAFVREKLILMPAKWSIEILLHTPIEAARCEVGPMLAILEPVPEGTLFRCTANSLRWLARRLLSLDCSWEVRQPPELITELDNLVGELGRNLDRSRADTLIASAS